MLEDIGVLTKQIYDDGPTRYEVADDKNGHNHHHLYCVKCGSVIEIQDEYLDELEDHIKEDKDFSITNHEFTFYVICKKFQILIL